ncbi:MAG: HAD family hydrolase [Acidobacteria bacterium]|nr:HAD family hydrolase [Acidobacteriota bacterium]
MVLGDEPLVIFDCDGVLVDSEILVVMIESELLKEVGIHLTPMEVAALFVGLSETDMNRVLAERWGVQLSAEFQERKTARIREAFDISLQPVTGMAELLSGSTRARCVASSARPERIRQSLALTGLDGYFEHLFSAVEVERGKPAPDLFLHAAASLGARTDRCVVVEDSPSGVAAGVAAGMCVIGFTGGSHCPPAQADVLSERGAIHIVRDTTELAGCIDALLPA